MDHARRHPDPQARKAHQAFVDLMIPIVKGHTTEVAQDVASLGVQVHGGMGYIEETGAAQYLRDARIITIYEGTTGIQANDLIGRKTARDGGATAQAVIAEVKKTAAQLTAHPHLELHPIGAALSEAVVALEGAVEWVAKHYGTQPRTVHATAVTYLKLWGLVTSGWQLGRGALVAAGKLAAEEGDADFMRTKIGTARFFAAMILPQCPGLARTVKHGGEAALEVPAEQF